MAEKTGVIPPQNLEAEASLLGAILIDSDAIVRIADTVDAADFYAIATFTRRLKSFTKNIALLMF
jgi:replicative DNA helicase